MVCRRRRAWVVLVLGCSSAVAAAGGCGNRESKIQESRRLIVEGTAMRDAGWKSGDQEKFLEGQEMLDEGEQLREEALEGM